MGETTDSGGEVRPATPAATSVSSMPESAAPAMSASVTMSPSMAMSNLQREQVLARRRTALILLMIAAVATLVGAIVTGNLVLLGVTLVVDVALAVYIAVLLQIKQRQATTRFRSSPLAEGPPDEMRMVSY